MDAKSFRLPFDQATLLDDLFIQAHPRPHIRPLVSWDPGTVYTPHSDVPLIRSRFGTLALEFIAWGTKERPQKEPLFRCESSIGRRCMFVVRSIDIVSEIDGQTYTLEGSDSDWLLAAGIEWVHPHGDEPRAAAMLTVAVAREDGAIEDRPMFLEPKHVRDWFCLSNEARSFERFSIELEPWILRTAHAHADGIAEADREQPAAA